MIRAILVDDEPSGIGVLRAILSEHCPEVEVVATCGDATSAAQAIRAFQPDLVFLDIAMPGKSGIEMLKELPPMRTEFIFVTAYDRYSIDAFRLSAVDYLLKPVDETLLVQAVQRAQARILSGQLNERMDALAHNMARPRAGGEMKLCLPSSKGFVVVPARSIICCEASGSYTVFHLAGGSSLTASKSLQEYEALLETGPFLRVHKSHLVNLEHVVEYQRGEGGVVILSDGREVEVARRRKEAFLAEMKERFHL